MNHRACRCRISALRKICTKRFTSHFKVVEHIVPCQHTRQYPGGAELGHENELRLAVKQYVPHSQPSSSSRPDEQVTLIADHANGFPKELYEPMWDNLYERLEARGQTIRSIWIADMAPQGASGVLNEKSLGDDPNWWDQARDLMFLINQKQKEMPQPLIGIGHSVGASHLAALSLLHPRLLQSLILIDPVIQTENPSMTFAPPSTYRRDLWPSRQDAVAAFGKSKFYQKWDQRVLEKWCEYGLREIPTELYSSVNTTNEKGKVPVTLTTSKAQEVFQYLRPLYKSDPRTDKELYADFDPTVLEENENFYRPEPREIFHRLPELYPTVHYIFGRTSEVATPDLRQKKVETTGSGIGGNGGVAMGQVTETVLDCGHLVPMEATKECATAAADFIHVDLDQWRARKDKFERSWRLKSRVERIGIDDEWRRNIGPAPERPSKRVSGASPSDVDSKKPNAPS